MTDLVLVNIADLTQDTRKIKKYIATMLRNSISVMSVLDLHKDKTAIKTLTNMFPDVNVVAIDLPQFLVLAKYQNASENILRNIKMLTPNKKDFHECPLACKLLNQLIKLKDGDIK